MREQRVSLSSEKLDGVGKDGKPDVVRGEVGSIYDVGTLLYSCL